MKLTSAQIGAFLQKPDPAIRVILLYGPDAGLVRERADQIARGIVADLQDPFRVAVLTSPMISDDPARLHDEMAAQALGGGRRLVRLQQVTESAASPLGSLLTDMPASDSLLLIEGGELEKRSKLRSVCENDGHLAVALPCYVEEGAARQRLVGEILQAWKLRASREVLTFLADILPPDRIALRSELDKLALYAHGRESVTMEDVLAIVQDAGAAELDDLIFAVGLGEAKRATLLIDRLFAEQTSVVAILRAAQRHFLRLSWARYHMDAGISAGEAVKKLQPPVFWKYTDSMAGQLRRWPRTKIDRALLRLYETEAAVKRTGAPDQILCAQLLLGMAA